MSENAPKELREGFPKKLFLKCQRNHQINWKIMKKISDGTSERKIKKKEFSRKFCKMPERTAEDSFLKKFTKEIPD